MQPKPESPPSSPDDASRPTRRERRHHVRRTFGTKLLTTFAILFAVVTLVVFVATGLVLNSTNERVLERQVTRHLESVARGSAADLERMEDRPGLTLTLLQQAQFHKKAIRAPAQRRLRELCVEMRNNYQVREVVVFSVSAPEEPDQIPDVEILASSGNEERLLLGRLLADARLAITDAQRTGRPASSTIWKEELPEGVRFYKSAYMPVHGPDGKIRAMVGVELPAEFAKAVNEVDNTFIVLAALGGLVMLLAAVFLVRQRVHVPLYRLRRAMESDTGPQTARVRHNDEIGVLTEHYNHMVERLVEKDQKLRELYDQARVTASYLKGYSNSLVAGVPSGVVAVDPDGLLTVWNASAQRILRTVDNLGEPLANAQSALARALKNALQGSATDQALIVLEFPGEEGDEPEQRLIEMTCGPFHNEEGELLGAVALLSDRTELEQLRRVASRNERLAAIGSLGGGLAHEIKNPLGAISGFAELIERKADADTSRLAKRLQGEIRELNTFLNMFLSFARDDSIRRERTPLRDLLERSVETALQSQGVDPQAAQAALEGKPVELKSGASLIVRLELAEDLPQLALDRALMRSAFMNLACNAIQAMEEAGGELIVRTHKVGQGIYVRFRDRGPGIPLENREKIFDPLFTTRAEGTGLGLAICHKTVTAHGGKLTVREPPGGGAEFVVRLPLITTSSSTRVPKVVSKQASEGEPWPGS